MKEKRYRASAQVWAADLGEGETALFDSRTQRYLTVNETGRAVWEALREPATVADAAAALVAEFEVDQAGAEAAVREFIPQLLAEDLVTEA